MQRFRVNLKTFLGLAMPNQCCHAVRKADFLVGFLGKKPQTLYSTILLLSSIGLYNQWLWDIYYGIKSYEKLQKLIVALVFDKLISLYKFNKLWWWIYHRNNKLTNLTLYQRHKI